MAGTRVIGVGLEDTADGCDAYVQADCTVDDLSEVIREHQPDAVFHGAGTGSIQLSLSDPQSDFRASVVSFQRILDATRREAPNAHVVFPSSASVYGEPESLPVAESAPIRPISPYGHHKAMCELLASEYSTCFDLRVTCLRIFSTFGFRQRKLLVWELAKQSIESGEIVVRGTGAEERDYLLVEDVVAVVFAAAQHATSQVVNVASGSSLTVASVAEAVAMGAGERTPIHYLGGHREGNPQVWRGDTTRLSDLITLPDRDLRAEIAELTRRWREAGLVESSA